MNTSPSHAPHANLAVLLEAFASAPDKVAREVPRTAASQPGDRPGGTCVLNQAQVAAYKPRTQTAPGRWHVRPLSDCGRIEMDSQEL
jgi:hypothetical protein